MRPLSNDCQQTPRVNINLRGIIQNARRLRQECERRNISLTGVVKGAAGDLRVARAFVRGGLEIIGDSRLQNLISLKAGLKGYTGDLVLLRLPQLTEIDRIVDTVDVSLISEEITARRLSEAAGPDYKHGVIIMVDVGDLREGILPGDVPGFMERIKELPGLEVRGLGTNVGCYGGVLPTVKNTGLLLELRETITEKFNVKLEVISGGNTATTILFEEDRLPDGINNLRIGEAILQGTDITNQRQIEYLNQDNFTLTAQIIELKRKPSLPRGERGYDAFGNQPEFEDRGPGKRAILAVGKQDVKIEGLTPFLEGVDILGASSDHLILDVREADRRLRETGKPGLEVGQELTFRMDYGALLAAMTSDYVYKNYLNDSGV